MRNASVTWVLSGTKQRRRYMTTTSTDFGRYGRVVLTYGRSLMSLVAAQSLSRRGIEVYGCDSVDMTALRFSKYCSKFFTHADREADEGAYFASLVARIEEFRPDDDRPYILMPMFDDARLLARRAADLPDFIKLAAPGRTSIDRVYPKDRLVATMAKFEGLSPASEVVEPTSDVADALQQLDFPLVLKPVEGVGGRGVRFVDDETELAEAYAENVEARGHPQILQEAAPGDDYCLTFIARNGEIHAAMAYRNLDSFPRKSGSGSVRETVDHEPFMDTARAVARACDWNGVAEIDFRWDGETKTAPQLIEVNARFWAGLYHSMASGIDYPWLLYQLTAYGDIAERTSPIIGVRSRTPILSTMSMFSAVAEETFRFRAARRLIRRGWRKLIEGDVGRGLVTMLHGVRGAFKFNDGAFAAFEKIDQNKDATSEFDNAPDPFAGLGFLFIVSSLLRYGRLPDEVKF